MSKFESSLRGEVEYKKETKTVIFDKRVFKVCQVKEERLGIFRRKILFVHFDGQTWNVLHANEDFTDVKSFKIT